MLELEGRAENSKISLKGMPVMFPAQIQGVA